MILNLPLKAHSNKPKCRTFIKHVRNVKMCHPYDVNVTYGILRFLSYLSSFVDKYRPNQPGSQGLLLFYFLTHNIRPRQYLVFKKKNWISSLVNGAHVQKATRFYYFPITSRTNNGIFSHLRGAICRKTDLVTMLFYYANR